LVEWGLGAGETAVLALAQERGLATAVLDDAAARACAKACGISIIGTLGIVVRAKAHRLIPSAADVLKSILNAEFYLDENVIREVLKRIGETW
jgi:predicted nucleic acid-binding protein